MYAPPWARDAAPGATEAALAAAEKLRSALPPAPLLTKPEVRPRRRERAFDGDIAIRQLRERASLDPVPVPAPPLRARGSAVGVLARVFGAVGIAALAAFFMVGTAPLSLAVKADDGATGSFWSRFAFPAGNRPPTTQNSGIRLAAAESRAPVALVERFAAASPTIEAASAPSAQPVKIVAISPVVAPTAAPVSAAEPSARTEPAVGSLDREEIATLYKRGEELVAQGDVAAARLMFARAAEAGDARAALALGAAYDPDVLKKLGVLGVAADTAQAREWYERAAQFGSGEATRRLEQLAQAIR